MSDDLVIIRLVDGIPDPPPWWVADAPHMVVGPSPLVPAARMWMVDGTAPFSTIPAAVKRYAARAVMRFEQSVIVRGYGAQAVSGVAAGLRRMMMIDGDGG